MVKFQSNGFYYFLIGLLGLLLVINFLTLLGGNIYALITISILGAVFFAVLTKQTWVKKALYIWSTILLIAGGSKILATFLRLTDYKFFDGQEALQEIIWTDVILRSSFLVFGLVVIIFTKKTVILNSETDTQESEAAK